MPMSGLVSGIHHITVVAGDPRKNVRFYAGLLGLRLVKKTVNFDAPGVYHFYYGDEKGLPGSILTFFPYGEIRRGRQGTGMAGTISFSAPAASRPFWTERLAARRVSAKDARHPLDGAPTLDFIDDDGLSLSIVFNDKDIRPGRASGSIPAEHSIRGFFGVEVWEASGEETAGLLTTRLDHRLVAQEGNRSRYAATDAPGHYVDVLVAPGAPRGQGGAGTVHHMAFATADMETQARVRASLLAARPTPPIDRQYFTSVYFHEPGGVLFEIATVGPGFAVDEPLERLGESLKLPPQYEDSRAEIEARLVPVTVEAG
jgi:glyoxalase family protein